MPQLFRCRPLAILLILLALLSASLLSLTTGPWLQLASLQAQRPYDLPKEPIEFAAHEPKRPNALDLLPTVNGYAFLRYQRATNEHFSLIFDLNGYLHIINLFRLTTQSLYNSGSVTLDLRAGAGIGLAFWPWESLRKGYIALRSQLQLQMLQGDIDGTTFNHMRFLVGSNFEIGARLGRKVASMGVFGGVGFQVTTDERTFMPKGYSLPMIFAYLGISFGLTFR